MIFGHFLISFIMSLTIVLKDAVKLTQIDNLSYSSYYEGDLEVSGKDGTPTQDRIYLASLEDMLNKQYGFVNNHIVDDPVDKGFSFTEARKAEPLK